MNTRRRIRDVHIIESNRPTEPIAEGMALTSILKISDIEAHPYVVGTRTDLEAAVAAIAAPARCIRKAARLCGRTASQLKAIVVDRFFETKREAIAWTNAHPHFMTLQVIRPGSHEEPSEL